METRGRTGKKKEKHIYIYLFISFLFLVGRWEGVQKVPLRAECYTSAKKNPLNVSPLNLFFEPALFLAVCRVIPSDLLSGAMLHVSTDSLGGVNHGNLSFRRGVRMQLGVAGRVRLANR